jgi:superfamily II DNA/RNA helicase
MLDMGFLPDIRQIVDSLPVKRQTLLFSASLSREIEQVTRDFLHEPKLVQIGRRASPTESVTQFVYEVPRHLKSGLLAHLLRDPSMNMVLVFSRMKHGADRIAQQLERHGIATATLHSNRSQSQRMRALKDFKSGAVRVLVATDIAARGIDVDGISHVVNYDFPAHSEDYVHRIGRTGRANAVGDAISFVSREERDALRALEKFIGRGIIRKRAEGFDTGAMAVAEHAPQAAAPRRSGPSQPARTFQPPPAPVRTSHHPAALARTSQPQAARPSHSQAAPSARAHAARPNPFKPAWTTHPQTGRPLQNRAPQGQGDASGRPQKGPYKGPRQGFQKGPFKGPRKPSRQGPRW